MKDPVAEFKVNVVRTPKGGVHVYHLGSLASDIASSPTLTNIQMFANGLALMGRVGLRQARKTMEFGDPITEYSLKILQPVHVIDFDTARKAFLDSVRH